MNEALVTEAQSAEIDRLVRAAFSTDPDSAGDLRRRIRNLPGDFAERILITLAGLALSEKASADRVIRALEAGFSRQAAAALKAILCIARLTSTRPRSFQIETIAGWYQHVSRNPISARRLAPIEDYLLARLSGRSRTEIELAIVTRRERQAKAARLTAFRAAAQDLWEDFIEQRTHDALAGRRFAAEDDLADCIRRQEAAFETLRNTVQEHLPMVMSDQPAPGDANDHGPFAPNIHVAQWLMENNDRIDPAVTVFVSSVQAAQGAILEHAPLIEEILALESRIEHLFPLLNCEPAPSGEVPAAAIAKHSELLLARLYEDDSGNGGLQSLEQEALMREAGSFDQPAAAQSRPRFKSLHQHLQEWAADWVTNPWHAGEIVRQSRADYVRTRLAFFCMLTELYSCEWLDAPWLGGSGRTLTVLTRIRTQYRMLRQARHDLTEAERILERSKRRSIRKNWPSEPLLCLPSDTNDDRSKESFRRTSPPPPFRIPILQAARITLGYSRRSAR